MRWIWSEADTQCSILPDVLLMMETTQWSPSSHIIIISSLTAHLSQVLLSKIQSNTQNLARGLFLLIVIRRKQQYLRHITIIIRGESLDWGTIYNLHAASTCSELCQGQSGLGHLHSSLLSCWALTWRIMLVQRWFKWTERDSFTKFTLRRECIGLL